MTDYSLSSNKKRSYADDTTYLPTAEKFKLRQSVDLYETTPRKLNFASPNRPERFSETRKSIDQCIQLISSKKRLNEEAINQVRHVNQELISSLNNLDRNIESYHEIEQPRYPRSQINRSNQSYKHQDNYNLPSTNYPNASLTSYNPAKSQIYQGKNKTANQRYNESERDIPITDFNLNWNPNSEEQLQRSVRSNLAPKSPHVNKENNELRSRLNDEIKKNNGILKYVNKLETEIGSLKSSSAGFGGQNNPSVNQLLEENRRLKYELSTRQQSNVPYNLIQQLERLKEQNGILRKDTIKLLKIKQN